MSEIKTQQLQTLVDQGDYEGAAELIRQQLKQPLTDEEEGMYYTELMRVYMRYMTELNNELAAVLEEGQQLMRDIDRREQKVLNQLSETGDATE